MTQAAAKMGGGAEWSEDHTTISEKIWRFLAGDNDGQAVLPLLYPSLADEELPERFRLLIGQCRCLLAAS
jgi:hypothetical protein